MSDWWLGCLLQNCPHVNGTRPYWLLVKVMALCHQGTSHYLSQCEPSFMSPYGVTRNQSVKPLVHSWLILICMGFLFTKMVFTLALIRAHFSSQHSVEHQDLWWLGFDFSDPQPWQILCVNWVIMSCFVSIYLMRLHKTATIFCLITVICYIFRWVMLMPRSLVQIVWSPHTWSHDDKNPRVTKGTQKMLKLIKWPPK